MYQQDALNGQRAIGIEKSNGKTDMAEAQTM